MTSVGSLSARNSWPLVTALASRQAPFNEGDRYRGAGEGGEGVVGQAGGAAQRVKVWTQPEVSTCSLVVFFEKCCIAFRSAGARSGQTEGMWGLCHLTRKGRLRGFCGVALLCLSHQ